MVSSIKLISNEIVKKVLKYQDLIPAIEHGLKDYSNNDVLQPLRAFFSIPEHNGFFGSMPAYNANQNSLAIKCLCFYPDNNEKKLPTHTSQIMLYDPNNGTLLALMDGEVITEMRTAAASAVATKYLAKKDSKVLAVVGAGAQGRSHIFALSSIYQFDKISIYNRTAENGMKLCEAVKDFANTVNYCSSVEDAVLDADIIVTATASQVPLLHGKWLKEGVHINCVGACRPNWRELDDDCMRMCDVYADSKTSATTESGDIVLSKKEVVAEVGQLVSGEVEASRSNRTLFKSLGIGAEDVVTADLVWKSLNKAGLN